MRHEGAVLLRSLELDAEEAGEAVIGRIRACARSQGRFDIRSATNGGFYFTLCDEAGNVLGRSPNQSSREACERAIAIVQSLAQTSEDVPHAPVRAD